MVLRPAAGLEPQTKIVLDREVWKNFPALRRIGEPPPHPAIRAVLRDVHSLKPDATGLRSQQAHHGLQQRRLPDAVPPHQADHLARLHLKGDVPENVALPIEHVEIIELQQHPLPSVGRDRFRRRADRPEPFRPGLRRAPCLRARPSPSVRSAVRTPCHVRSR